MNSDLVNVVVRMIISSAYRVRSRKRRIARELAAVVWRKVTSLMSEFTMVV